MYLPLECANTECPEKVHLASGLAVAGGLQALNAIRRDGIEVRQHP